MKQNKPRGMGVVIAFGRPQAPPEDGGMVQRRRHAADVEAAFTGRPQPHGTFDEEHDGGRVSEQAAGYMELDEAQKDGECDLVQVAGGISAERGCCNLFAPQNGADEFRCGECTHFVQTRRAPAALQREAVNG